MSHSTTNNLKNSQVKTEVWKRYFTFNTDHKVIGIQYLVTTFIFFLIAGIMSMMIRGELITPASDLVDRSLYNGLFTLHGTVMIFLWIIPSLVGLANYLIPLMIGAKDMAFPKLNAIAFWLIPVGGTLLLSSFLLPSGTAQAGWWSYPPVSIQNPTGYPINGETIWLLSIIFLGVYFFRGDTSFYS
uniref:cbb3-type cytochrome c oxidase subunit I n=1 Tax=Cyanothece sp. BG0011 TaxID=2082950 RepID=UPI001E517E7C|nr:cbb3-type cytochrome c oxidase subunit I [Cyanothece sp. BG0011]